MKIGLLLLASAQLAFAQTAKQFKAQDESFSYLAPYESVIHYQIAPVDNRPFLIRLGASFSPSFSYTYSYDADTHSFTSFQITGASFKLHADF